MGRKSSIDYLPDTIRARLDKLLLDKRVTIEAATRYVNEWLAEHAPATVMDDGAAPLDEPEKISKSAVGRYRQTLDEMTKEVAETDRLAALMLKELNITNQSSVAQATAETLRVMLMRFIPLLRQSMQAEELSIKDMKDITGMLKDLSAGHERLENSATINQKRLLEAKREAAKEAKEAAAKVMDEATKAMGLDGETAMFWRQKVLQGGV